MKVGSVVEVLQRHNSVWCGVPMKVIKMCDGGMMAICKHPERGDGGFPLGHLRPWRKRRPKVDKSDRELLEQAKVLAEVLKPTDLDIPHYLMDPMPDAFALAQQLVAQSRKLA